MSLKAEPDNPTLTPAPTPAPAPAPTPTPAPSTGPTFSAAQWGNQIPIDPALQQTSQPTPQPTSAYYQYYSQTPYQYSYPPPPAAQPSAAATAQTQPAASTSRAQPAAVQQPATTAAEPSTDIATLNDALGSAGVDLKAEEESLQRSGPYDSYASYRPYEDRSRKQPAKPNFDARFIGATMRTIGTQHQVPKVPEETVNYLALSLRARLQDLITEMIAASAHRTDTQFDRPAALYDEDKSPMWSVTVRRDVAKQLAAIEKVEREEEMRVRRERKERAEAAAAQASALGGQGGAGGGADGGAEEEGPKKKKKKEGPGVTARNMSEDARKKMSNAVASQAAGLGTGKYAWMNQASAATPAPKAKTGATGSGATTPATTTTPATSTKMGSWARAYTKSGPSLQKEDDSRRPITLRDALFVIEKEKGHGGGRGSARGWT